MNSTPLSFRNLLGALLLSALALSARAQLISNTTAVQTNGGAFTTNTRDTFGGSGVLSFAGSVATSFVNVNAQGATMPGMVSSRTFGTAGVANGSSEQSVTSRANVTYGDSLTVTGAPDGTTGIFSASFSVTQLVDYSVVGLGSAITQGPYTATIGMGDAVQTFTLTLAAVSGAPTLLESTFPQNSLVTLNTPFVYGTPFSLSLSLEGQAHTAAGGGGATGLSSIDITTALYWAGGARAADSDGHALPFSLSAASGLDYNRSYAPGGISPVPEPATYGIATAVLLCGLILRRRQSVGERSS